MGLRGTPVPSERRRKLSGAWRADRGFLRVSNGQDARRKRPATGHGELRPRENAAKLTRHVAYPPGFSRPPETRGFAHKIAGGAKTDAEKGPWEYHAKNHFNQLGVRADNTDCASAGDTATAGWRPIQGGPSWAQEELR